MKTMQITAKNVLSVLAVVLLVAAATFWYGVMAIMTPVLSVRLTYMVLMTLGPSLFLSFLMPTTVVATWVRRQQWRTVGQWIAALSAVVMGGWSFWLLFAWCGQVTINPVLVESGYVLPQAIMAWIGFVVVPALAFAGAVSNPELVAMMEQTHLVKRYELQTKAELQMVRQLALRAESLAQVGIAHLTDAERAEFQRIGQGMLKGLVASIDEMRDGVAATAGVQVGREESKKLKQLAVQMNTAFQEVVTPVDRPTGTPAVKPALNAPRPEQRQPQPQANRAVQPQAQNSRPPAAASGSQRPEERQGRQQGQQGQRTQGQARPAAVERQYTDDEIADALFFSDSDLIKAGYSTDEIAALRAAGQ